MYPDATFYIPPLFTIISYVTPDLVGPIFDVAVDRFFRFQVHVKNSIAADKAEMNFNRDISVIFLGDTRQYSGLVPPLPAGGLLPLPLIIFPAIFLIERSLRRSTHGNDCTCFDRAIERICRQERGEQKLRNDTPLKNH